MGTVSWRRTVEVIYQVMEELNMKYRLFPVFVIFGILLFVHVTVHAQHNQLHELVKNGSEEEVKAAIRNGADVNSRGISHRKTPLWIAAEENGNPEVIRALIDAGAELDARDSL